MAFISALSPNYLFTMLDSPSRVSDSPVSADTVDLWSLCWGGEIWVGLLCIAWMEEPESLNKSILHSSFSTRLLSSRGKKAEKSNLVPPSQQRLHKSQFLKKLGCQKPCLDLARLSSLVNKQVALSPPSIGPEENLLFYGAQLSALLSLGRFSSPSHYMLHITPFWKLLARECPIQSSHYTWHMIHFQRP